MQNLAAFFTGFIDRPLMSNPGHVRFYLSFGRHPPMQCAWPAYRNDRFGSRLFSNSGFDVKLSVMFLSASLFSPQWGFTLCIMALEDVGGSMCQSRSLR